MEDVVIECPLGSECTSIRENKQYRCAWYTKIVGKDPQSNKEFDEWGCSMSWLPVLLVENARTNRGQTMAINEQTNAQVRGQAEFNSLLVHATDTRNKLIG